MRKKVSTLVDDALYRRAKLESALSGKQISEIIGEALEQYLDRRDRSVPPKTVSESWASLALPVDELQQIMADEDWLDS